MRTSSPPPRQFYAGRPTTVFMAICTPLLLAAAPLAAWGFWTAKPIEDAGDLVFAVATASFFGLFALSLGLGALWWLQLAVRDKPLLHIDARGVLYGDDWDSDAGIEWSHVRRIEGVPAKYGGAALRGTVRPRRSFRVHDPLQFFGICSTLLYGGSPLVLSAFGLRGTFVEIVDAVRVHYRGEISLDRVPETMLRG